LIIFKLRADLHAHIARLKQRGNQIGFVPTMGALHQGHLSLIENSQRENDFTVCSVFVNPSQFNNAKDLSSYPRTLDLDLHLLAQTGCDMVYAPETNDVYTDSTDYSFDLGNLNLVMEAAHRPGHFSGVINVLKRLFDIVTPHRAYFGQKDLQQCLVVKKLVKHFDLDIDVRVCPLIRETDGLAMSSRNTLLSEHFRKKATLIYEALVGGSQKITGHTPAEVREEIINLLKQDPDFTVDYVEIAEGEELLPVHAWADAQKIVACVAVHLGGVRLIDNLVIK